MKTPPRVLDRAAWQRWSGEPRINPMMYPPGGDWMIMIASTAGSPGNPDWYVNLKARPHTRVEVGTETVEVTAMELAGEERQRMFAEQAHRYPGFQIFQDHTSRAATRVATRKALATGPVKRWCRPSPGSPHRMPRSSTNA